MYVTYIICMQGCHIPFWTRVKEPSNFFFNSVFSNAGDTFRSDKLTTYDNNVLGRIYQDFGLHYRQGRGSFARICDHISHIVKRLNFFKNPLLFC